VTPARLLPSANDTSTRILELLFRFRRLVADDPCEGEPCEHCYAIHRTKLDAFIKAGEPIQFVIPAFPAKSPNPRKVLGPLPDLAERLALDFLQSFCEYLSHFHPPGGRIMICSDGHVFGDLVGVPDPVVSTYRRELDRILAAGHTADVTTFGLEDAFGEQEYPLLRRLLETDYAMSTDELKYWVRRDPRWLSLFNGIHRFVLEDQLVLRADESKNKVRQKCKDLAYQVIRRSNAWGAVVAERFPDALRLSIHPQAAHSEKIGFHMVRTRDNWLTPWHSVALDSGGSFTLVKRSDAERMNASLIWRGNQPSHFVAP
jgi:pyoverdine/dityrosine biosynthesis protein Dit1